MMEIQDDKLQQRILKLRRKQSVVKKGGQRQLNVNSANHSPEPDDRYSSY